MTEKELDALEAAAKAATPGPWETDYRQRYIFAENGVNVCEIRGYGELIHMVPESDVIEQIHNNAAFIAAANPAAVLELIAELRRARRERDWLAGTFGNLQARECPPNRSRWSKVCREVTCEKCWLEAAKEAAA